MKTSYIKPSVTYYRRDEIMDMLGPVKTQYVPPPPPPPPPLSCSVDVNPNAILRNKAVDVTVRVATSGSGTFNQVEIAVPGSSPFAYYQFTPEQGTMSGNDWIVTLPGFVQNADGVFDVIVTLSGPGGPLTTCATVIQIE